MNPPADPVPEMFDDPKYNSWHPDHFKSPPRRPQGLQIQDPWTSKHPGNLQPHILPGWNYHPDPYAVPQPEPDAEYNTIETHAREYKIPVSVVEKSDTHPQRESMKDVKRTLRTRPWANLTGAEIITVKPPFIPGFDWTDRHLLRRIIQILYQRFFDTDSTQRPHYPHDSGAVVHLDKDDFVDTNGTILSQLPEAPLLKNRRRPYFGVVVVVPDPPTRRLVHRQLTYEWLPATVHNFPMQMGPFHPRAFQVSETYQPLVNNSWGFR